MHHTILAKFEQINIDEKNRYFKIDSFDIKEITKEMMIAPFSLFLASKLPHDNLVYLLENRDYMQDICSELYDFALFKKNYPWRSAFFKHKTFADNEIVHVIRFKNGKQFFLNYREFNEFKNIFVDLLLVQQHFHSVETIYKNDSSN